MEAGNWIALGAVAAAITSNGVTLWLGRRAFQHDLLMANREVAGEILDDAVIQLRKIEDLLEELQLELRQHPYVWHKSKRGQDTFKELEVQGNTLNISAERLRFRFHGDRISEAFQKAIEASIAVYNHASEMQSEEVPPTREHRADAQAIIRKMRDQADADILEFQLWFEKFREEAFKLVGVESR